MTDPETLFELSEEMGSGTYGKVFSARKRQTGEEVAVKIIAIGDDKMTLKREVDIMKREF